MLLQQLLLIALTVSSASDVPYKYEDDGVLELMSDSLFKAI